MGGLFQPMHLLLILIIVLIIFGPSKLAGIGKELGKGIKNFKDSMSDENASQTTQTTQTQPTPEIKPAPNKVEEIKIEAKAPQASQKENG
jgi:sec-independent protein translocase protein TatA